MLAEFQFEDITFGIFPKVGGSVQHAYGCWTKNSVGDNIEMLMQMLEVNFVSSSTAFNIENINVIGPCIYSQLEYCSSSQCSSSQCSPYSTQFRSRNV